LKGVLRAENLVKKGIFEGEIAIFGVKKG